MEYLKVFVTKVLMGLSCKIYNFGLALGLYLEIYTVNNIYLEWGLWGILLQEHVQLRNTDSTISSCKVVSDVES